jgi:hypothetical protein
MIAANSTTNVTRPTTPVLRTIRIHRSELVSISAVMTTFFPSVRLRDTGWRTPSPRRGFATIELSTNCLQPNSPGEREGGDGSALAGAAGGSGVPP